jgi:hypothetical protein
MKMNFWRTARPVERAGYLVGALLLLSGLIHVAILTIGGGSWDGPLSLRKAATFGLSFGITVITIVWVASFLRLSDRARTLLLTAFTAASVFETTLVSMQAWRGVPSHFNMETTFDAVVAQSLAVGGFTLVVILVALTIASFRANPTVPVSLQIAIRVGFIALLGSMTVGGLMIARGVMLVVAGDPSAAYATGGSLKPMHAVMMHGILVLPALAWLMTRANWSESRRVAIVLAATLGYGVLAAVVTLKTLAIM